MVGGRQGWQGGRGALLALGKDKPGKFTGRMGGHSGSCGLSESPPGSAFGPRIFIRGFDPTLATTPSPAPCQV